MMNMQAYKENRAGRSDPRCRQGGAIVPGPPRSGPSGESYYGLLTQLAASCVGELAIAGTASACSAGALAFNTPAKGRTRGEMPPFYQTMKREVGPLRLRGGADGEEDTSDDPTSVVHGTEHQVPNIRSRSCDTKDKGEGVGPHSSSIEETGRSRSPHGIRITRARTTSARGQKEVKKEVAEPRGENSDSTIVVDSGDSSDRFLEIAPLRKRTESAESNTVVADQPGPSGSGKRRALQPLEAADFVTTTTSGENGNGNGKGQRGARQPPKESSSSEDDGPQKGTDRRRKKKKTKRRMGPEAYKKAKDGTAGSNADSDRIAKLRAAAAGKRGRPPSTGEYVQLAAARKAANDERERERRLEMETRTFEMSEILGILKSSRLNPDSDAEKLEHNPTCDIASRIREAQAEVVRISKISSNLKGDLQRALRVSASLTLGAIEVLRTRADHVAKKTGHEEVRALKERLDQLSRQQGESDQKLRDLTTELEVTKAAVLEERRKRECVLKQVKDASLKNEILKNKLSEERSKVEELRRASNNRPARRSPTREEPMEVEITPTRTGDTDAGYQSPTYAEKAATRPIITKKDLEEHPAMLPAIKGVRKRIPDVDNPPPEHESDPLEKKVSRKQKKGRSQADWGEMESFTSVPPAAEVTGTKPGPASRPPTLSSSSFPSLPAPRGESRAPDTRPSPKKEASGGGQQRVTPRPPPAGKPTAPDHPSTKKRMSEQRKAKRRENRRRKRQEAARLRAETEDRAGAPSDTRHGRVPRGSRPATAEDSGGPATRTRSKVTVAETRSQGPSYNVQIEDVRVPPTDWTLVQKKKKGKGQEQARPTRKPSYAETAARPTSAPRRDSRGATASRPNNKGTTSRPQQQPWPGAPQKAQPTPAPRKPPRTAAVQVTCPPGEYAETMRLARARVNIKDLGIPELRPRRARTGALLLEVPGADGGRRASVLAGKLREALGDREGITISQPVKTAEMRVKDIEDSISAIEIAEALAAQGGCATDDVRVGPIRIGANQLGTAWVRCPLVAANKIVKRGRLTLGWTRVRIELLPERATTCYKCLREGHVRAACPNDEDRADLCYRCGEAGHRASQCNREPRCPLCVGSNRPANHKAGGRACRAPKKAAKRSAQNERGQRREPGQPQTQPPPEPMEIEPERQPQRGQEPMDAAAEAESPEIRAPKPAPTPQLDYPDTGEGWEQTTPPQPSQPQGPITGEEGVPDPLQTSRPLMGPIIREEQVLDRRLVQVPVRAPDGQLTVGWRQEVREDEYEEEMAPRTADGGATESGGGAITPAEVEVANERPVGGGAPLELSNGE